MKKVLILVICILPGLTTDAQSGWVLKRDRDGIVIHTRESPDSPLKEYRMNAIVEGSFQDVVNFALDLRSRPEWLDNCKGVEIIDTLGERIRYHTGYDLPWPFEDRDLVAELQLVDFNERRAHLLTRSIDIEYPLEEGVIRMTRYREEALYEKVDEGHTRIRTEGFSDPGGKLPPWLVNLFLVDGIYDSVVETRNAVANSAN